MELGCRIWEFHGFLRISCEFSQNFLYLFASPLARDADHAEPRSHRTQQMFREKFNILALSYPNSHKPQSCRLSYKVERGNYRGLFDPGCQHRPPPRHIIPQPAWEIAINIILPCQYVPLAGHSQQHAEPNHCNHPVLDTSAKTQRLIRVKSHKLTMISSRRVYQQDLPQRDRLW